MVAPGDTGPAPGEGLARWRMLGVVSLGAMVVILGLRLAAGARSPQQSGPPVARFVGSEACKGCHPAAYESWRGSHHRLAMAPAREDTVQGDFDNASFTDGGKVTRFFREGPKYLVSTEGPDGNTKTFEIAYTLGWQPLQQVLIPFPGGRLQALAIAWDVSRRRWFSLHPGQTIPPTDWLHWTRAAQNWNGMCSECHSTDVRKRYDPERDDYQTTWSEISVGCEACHGPASLHLAWAATPPMGRSAGARGLEMKTSGLGNRELVNLCARCHSRRSQLRDVARPAGEPLDDFLPSLLGPGLYHADGQILDEDFEHQSFLQSKMFANGVGCRDCHDVHAAKVLKQGNALCVRCHRADTYDTAAHHFHGSRQAGKGTSCVDCHMPGRNYMEIHFRRDHGIRIPDPQLSAEIGTPNACGQSGCHADRPMPWIISSYRRWFGLERKPHYGTVLAAGRAGEPQAEQRLGELAFDGLRPVIVRASALELLGAYPGPDARQLVARGLSDSEALIRRTAAHHVQADGPEHLLRMLGPLLRDPVLAVRSEAASRLSEVPGDLFGAAQRQAFASALEQQREVLAYGADMPAGRYNLGLLEERLGRPEVAQTQYRRALAMDDQFFPAQVNLALLLNRQGKNAEAKSLLRLASRAQPRNATVAFNLGLLLAEEGEMKEAEAALARALEVDPRLAAAAHNLAILVAAREPARAVELSQQAATLRPDEPRYAFTLAVHELRLGRQPDAIRTLEDLVRRHPGHEDARALLAELRVAR